MTIPIKTTAEPPEAQSHERPAESTKKSVSSKTKPSITTPKSPYAGPFHHHIKASNCTVPPETRGEHHQTRSEVTTPRDAPMSSTFTPQKACFDHTNCSTTSSMTANTRRDAYFAHLYVLPSSDGTSYAKGVATSTTTSSTGQESLMERLASPALLNHQVRLCDLGCKFCAEDEKERRKARGMRGTLRRWWGIWKGEKRAYCGKEIWERHTKEQCRVYCRVEE